MRGWTACWLPNPAADIRPFNKVGQGPAPFTAVVLISRNSKLHHAIRTCRAYQAQATCCIVLTHIPLKTRQKQRPLHLAQICSSMGKTCHGSCSRSLRRRGTDHSHNKRLWRKRPPFMHIYPGPDLDKQTCKRVKQCTTELGA